VQHAPAEPHPAGARPASVQHQAAEPQAAGAGRLVPAQLRPVPPGSSRMEDPPRRPPSARGKFTAGGAALQAVRAGQLPSPARAAAVASAAARAGAPPSSEALFAEIGALRAAFASMDSRSGWLQVSALGPLFARLGPSAEVSDSQLLSLLLMDIQGKDATFTREGQCTPDQAAYLYARHRGETESYLEARAHRHPLVLERASAGRRVPPRDCDALEHEVVPGRVPKHYVCLAGCGFGICGRCLAPKVGDPFSAQQIMAAPIDA